MKKHYLRTVLILSLLGVFLLAGFSLQALDTEIGETEVFLDGERENVRTGETTLGNLITDIMLYRTGADIALTNGGGIRDSVDAGPITLEDVLDIHPFENIIVTVELSGGEIISALEHGVSQYPEHWGGFPHVSGLEYTFDPEKPAGFRIQEVLYQGETIEYGEKYTVATNDFLVAGGDDFTMLEKEILEEFDTMDQVILEYLQEYSPVAPEVEGRITIL